MTKSFKIGIAISALVISTASFATNGAELFQQKEEQLLSKEINTKEVKDKSQKYDFSLFKFVPYSRREESDSSQHNVSEKNSQAKREETADLYVIPRSFFMFS